MILIRKAEKQDAPSLQKLLAQMGENYQRTINQIEERITSFNAPMHELLIAEKEGEILGLIAFGCYHQFRLQGCCCHIDTLVVDKASRGLGIGKMLIQKAEEYAQKKEATEIELTTANYRRAHGTHAFYKSIGYRDHLEIDCTYFVKQKE